MMDSQTTDQKENPYLKKERLILLSNACYRYISNNLHSVSNRGYSTVQSVRQKAVLSRVQSLKYVYLSKLDNVEYQFKYVAKLRRAIDTETM